MNIIEVPSHFQVPIPFQYPAHQKEKLIEEYVFEYIKNNQIDIDTDLVYLPIFWTGFHVSNNWGNNPQPLQEYCDTLPKDKTYFTIVQYDDGTKVNMPNLITFSCCGNNPNILKDFPIPVLCDRHFQKRNSDYKYLASFIGRIGGKVRPAMFSQLQGKDGFFIQESSNNTDLFIDYLKNSLFSLCPRGYGITSFRMYESMELGCIPIYIVCDEDEHWLPFKEHINWNKLVILLKENEIHKIDSIIKNMPQQEIDERLNYINKCYEEFFTFEGCTKNILKTIENYGK